ncbi:MAG: hypothetical protein V4530_11460 [Pseudomonadota bacterium]
MATTDKSDRVSGENQYVTVDLPVRVSRGEFTKLAALAADRQTIESGPFVKPELRLARAIERVSAVIELRKRRDALFGREIFGEPAWEILLDLFIGRAKERKTSSTSAAIASRAPMTTALRYLSILEEHGLIIKRTAEHDLRVHYVQLTDDAYQAIIEMFEV